MTTDPRDAEIARLTAELRVYMDAAEAHAVETMRQCDRAEKAEAERDAALAQVAALREVVKFHERLTVDPSTLSRRDAQMRAEGLREAAGIARSIIDGRVYFNERARSDDEAFACAILAAAKKEET